MPNLILRSLVNVSILFSLTFGRWDLKLFWFVRYSWKAHFSIQFSRQFNLHLIYKIRINFIL